MSDTDRGPCCAHLRVDYGNNALNGTVTQEWWRCRDCGGNFIPEGLANYHKAALEQRVAEMKQMVELLRRPADPSMPYGDPIRQYQETFIADQRKRIADLEREAEGLRRLLAPIVIDTLRHKNKRIKDLGSLREINVTTAILEDQDAPRNAGGEKGNA